MSSRQGDRLSQARPGAAACLLIGLGLALPVRLIAVASGSCPGWGWIAVLAIGAAAGIAFEPLLRRLARIGRPGSYRWAAILGGGAVFLLALRLGCPSTPIPASAALFGAFLGSAAASWRRMGVWEDNYPPSHAAREAVRLVHASRFRAQLHLSAGKRAFDFALALIGLLVSSPLLLILSAAIWLEQPGPVFFVKNSVGLQGRTFRQWKLRTMVHGAEDVSGPVLAREDDARALRVGRWLRKTALDELPQLLNIVIGDMSFVGPRPQRTVLVLDYLQVMPEYADRHQVRPGLAGLAQVAGDYYLTPRQKLRLDRLYVLHADLLFDLWLVILACLVVFWWRWRPGWRGHLTSSQIRGGWRRAARAR